MKRGFRFASDLPENQYLGVYSFPSVHLLAMCLKTAASRKPNKISGFIVVATL
jgi:hypothetical protein